MITCKNENMRSQCEKNVNGIWSITSDKHWFTFLLSCDKKKKKKNEEDEKEKYWRAFAHEKVLRSSQRWGKVAAETPLSKSTWQRTGACWQSAEYVSKDVK